MKDTGTRKSDFMGTLSAFWGSSKRATARLIKNIVPRGIGMIKRKYREFKNRPPRKDISKVYVLVGYTTKKHVDDKFNAERRMIIMRRGLLVLIFVLLMFIALNRVTSSVNYSELSQMFGFDSVSDFIKNDPFSADKTNTTTQYSAQQIVNESQVAN